LKIGDLSKAAGTPVDTIRFYEREGLLAPPQRSGGNYRMYGTRELERLAFIRHCRCLDMSLDEIRVLLRHMDVPGTDCGEVDAVLDSHIGHVVARIRELRALEKSLRALRGRCTEGEAHTDCGILEGLQQEAAAHDHAAGRKKGHLH
jgi:Cd(II)/Pb(II)-responsive transcriptional regulator